MIRSILPGLLLGMVVVGMLSNAYAGENSISGTIIVQPNLMPGLSSEDRLVLKLYHPDEGVEKDTRYWIIDTFDLPRDFEIAPSTDMNGRVRWSTYMLEVFTDRDGDVMHTVPGELFSATNDLVPLGTEGLQLKLAEPDR